MKKFLSVLFLLFLCSGCLSLTYRCSQWNDYYKDFETYKVASTNQYYTLNKFTVYNSTCHILYTLDSPLRLFTVEPKGPEGGIANAYMILLWPLELVDLPFEFVFDTLFLPIDIYYHIEAYKFNKIIKERYGIE